MAVRIASISAKISLDGSAFEQTARRIGHTVSDLGFSAHHLQNMLIGAFSIHALADFGRKIVENVSRFRNMAEQMNITTDEVQMFDAAASASGQSIDDIAGPLNKLASARKSAAEGDEDLRDTFQRMGITLGDLNDPMLRNIDLMKRIAEHVQKVNFTAREASEFRDLFGRSGQQIAAVFRDLEKVHISPIREEDIDKIHEFNHAIEMLELRLQSLVSNVVNLRFSDFLPETFMGLDLNSKDRHRPGMSKEDVAAENARKHFRAQQAWEAGPEGPLFKDRAKEKRDEQLHKQVLAAEAKLYEKIFEVQLKTLSVTKQKAALEKEIQDHLTGSLEAAANGDRLSALNEAQSAVELLGQQNALGKSTNFLPGVKTSDVEQRGGFLGLSFERAFGLSAGVDSQKKTAENTRNTVRVLESILGKFQTGDAADTLDF